MTFLEIRNALISLLSKHMGMKITLAEQIHPVKQLPYCYYSVLTPYAPIGEMGDYSIRPSSKDSGVISTRREMPHATFSFTFVSQSRYVNCGTFVYGEDEAQQMAEQAQGYFLHVGYDELSRLGIVVVEIRNVTNRTTLVVDEDVRRYGFDVRIRYTRTDEREDATVGSVSLKRKEK